MAVLQKMRDKFGIVISVIIALSLLYFIAPMDDLMTLFGRPQNVGEIAGKGISYEDYQACVDKYTTVNEIVNGSSVQNEEAQKSIRESAWQEIVNKNLFVKNARNAGINVGTDEIVSLTTGENASPIISQNPFFRGQDGQFDQEAVVDFVQNLSEDESGRLRTYWSFLQDAVKIQSYYSKYMSLFTAGNFENALMSEYDTVRGNMTVDVKYVMASYPWQRDSSIIVSDSEVKNYYNSHKDDFKRTEGRDVEYVVYEVVPSAEDINAARAEFENVYPEFTTSDNLKSFLLRNSEQPYSEHWYKTDELKTVNAKVSDFVNNAKVGDVSPVIEDNGSFFAARVLASAQIPEAVYVKHILLQGENAASLADSLLNVINKGEKLSNLAVQYSVDKNSAADGEIGNIGWLSQSNMIPGFESVLTAKVNKPFVLKTQYGQHVIVVSDTRNVSEKKQVAILEKSTIPGKQTYNDFYAQANTFASLAGGTYEGFCKASDSLNVYAVAANDVKEGATTIGSINDTREVSRWIYENKKGKASQIISVNNKYFFIVAIKDVRKEGHTPLDEVSSRINNVLYSQKAHDKACEEVAAKIAGQNDIEAIAKILNASVEAKEGVSVAPRGSSVEPALAGAMVNAQENTICGPVEGSRGVYVFTVSNRQNGSFYTEDDAKAYSNQKAQYSTQMILPEMMKAADVKDYRARYF